MELGFSKQELFDAFGEALESSIKEVKIMQERTLRTMRGEFPSEEEALSEAMKKFEGITADDLSRIFTIALLKVIKANNARIAKQLEPYLKDSPKGE